MRIYLERIVLFFCLFSVNSLLFSAIQPFSFHLRRSVVDKNVYEKPAQLLINWPDDGDNHYMIDIGMNAILFSFGQNGDNSNSLWELGLFAEYHRNSITDEDKQQNTFLTGITLLGVIGDITVKKWSLVPQASIKYKNDVKSSKKSFVTSADIGLISLPLKIGVILGPSAIGFLWQPRIGIEFEKVFQAPEDKPTGQVFRLFSSLDIVIYPAQEILKKKLELALSYNYWRDFAESDSIDSGRDNHDLVRISLRYYLNKNVAVALERIDGENPLEGFVEQKYVQLAFQLKF